MTSIKPTPIIVNTKAYFDASMLKIYDGVFFNGTSRTIRTIITKKKIPISDYKYANQSKRNGWTLSSNQLKPASKAKLMISKDWVMANMPNMADDVVIQEAPAIFELDDNEKFKDSNGAPIDIETRGERSVDKIYFRAKHIAEAFEMPNLIKSINNKDTAYNIDEHYVVYNIPNNDVNSNRNSPHKKQIYFTYDGVIKVLFSSRSGNAKSFRSQSHKISFTHQMGSPEQKEDLSANLLGIDVKSLRAVLNKSATCVPCIYQFALGTVKTLRESMNLDTSLPDDHIIIKYGLTKDLVRRTLEHAREYGKIKGSALEIMNFVYIDPKFLRAAENDIKSFFLESEMPINYESYKELVAINPKNSKQIKLQFKNMSVKFAGSIVELTNQIELLKSNLLTHKQQHISEIKEKDLLHDMTKQLVEVKNMEIKKQSVEIELLELKLQMKK